MFDHLTTLIRCFALLVVAMSAEAQVFSFNGAEVTGCTGCGPVITIPGDDGMGTTVTSIGALAFRSENLTSVAIPNSVITIKNHAFLSNNLTSVTIPNNVTTIESGAFEDNSLASVIIPSSVTFIGGHPFGGNNLITILFEGDRPSFETATGQLGVNPMLATIYYRPSTTGWPGDDINGVTPTLLLLPETEVSPVPTLPAVWLMFLPLGLGVMAFRARKKTLSAGHKGK